jgi:predicted nucleic acid-binding Zn ribbon protein
MPGYSEKTLKEALLELMSQYRLKQGVNEAMIKAAWVKLMGTSIVSHTRQIRLVRKKLFIVIDSPALRQELFYGREKLRKILNEELKEEYLEEVIVK